MFEYLIRIYFFQCISYRFAFGRRFPRVCMSDLSSAKFKRRIYINSKKFAFSRSYASSIRTSNTRCSVIKGTTSCFPSHLPSLHLFSLFSLSSHEWKKTLQHDIFIWRACNKLSTRSYFSLHVLTNVAEKIK